MRWQAIEKSLKTPRRYLQVKAINPDPERFLAKRMNAKMVELNAGHLSLVSHSREIADMVLAAAGRKM